ncbi:hypothetical protein BZA77DRAFT_306922 [Pyronema omphalodes]|nr:hypothetical protein BZA77DRAFT_306922 [Pyronema omphalodes]
MPTTPAATLSKAGITTNAEGHRVIPASVRADGSVRREIAVRPGYRPPEDVEIYKNRNAEAWKNRGSGGVPGAAPVVKPEAKAGASEKNAKRKAARKRAKENEEKTDSRKDGEPASIKTAPPAVAETPVEPTKKAEPTPEDKEKLAKAIRKKIRQANELKNKKEGGENLLPEQLEKVIKMNELIRQLNALGFEQ